MRKKDSLAQIVNGDSLFLEIIELYYNLMYINHWMNEFKSLNKGIKEWLSAQLITMWGTFKKNTN